MNAIKISVVNQSTLFPDSGLPSLCNALAIQVSRDFYPVWGINAQMFYTPSGKHPTADHWVLGLFDDADVAGALGYHDETTAGLPLGKAFVRTTQTDGAQISVVVSHELIEMLGDPNINLAVEVDDASGNPVKFFAREACDAVEADNLGYEITIPAGWPGAGTKVLVSDFVTPAWFESFRTTGPFAFKTPLTKPFELAPGGYIGFLDLGNLAAGWQQLTARTPIPPQAITFSQQIAASRIAERNSMATIIRSRPHMGSRRQRRALPRSQWLRSTYEPGAEAVSAQQG